MQDRCSISNNGRLGADRAGGNGMKSLIWRNDFWGIECSDYGMCGKQKIDPQTCIHCNSAKIIGGKLDGKT